MMESSFVDETLQLLEHGDYGTCLDCWDKHVVNNPISSSSPQAVEACIRIEFTYHLICATFPFRCNKINCNLVIFMHIYELYLFV